MAFYYRTIIGYLLVLISLVEVQFVSAQSRCVNPNSNGGVCASIYDCPTIFDIISKPIITSEDHKFLVESTCTEANDSILHVCCTEDVGFITKLTETGPDDKEPESHPILPSNGQGDILPSPPLCGLVNTAKKIYNGYNTGLDEYTWMAILEYRKGKRQECGGSLINQRYVLTAAHCLTGDVVSLYGKLETVRLGEYNTSSEIDCIGTVCADPVLTVGVEEIIPHEGFIGKNDQSNDIGLIRLNQDVPLSRFISVICLPWVVGATRSVPGMGLVVVGWGRTLLARRSPVKQKLYVPVVPQEDCISKYEKYTNITDEQFCAGGKFAEDSCNGDSGGPIMKNQNGYWVIEGIISFGHACGLEDWPAVYTRVSSFEDWIKSKLKP